MNKILELKNIYKSFDDLKVLDDVSLHINRGEIVTLLGPSGSGKTTLFKIAAGLIKQDQGNIFYDESLRQGYVFQEPRLLPWRTIEDNFRFVQKNYLEPKKAKSVRNSLLKLTNLEQTLKSYPAELSGGMKQRIEILKAISIKPNFLIMDEPLKSVDTQTVVNLRNLLLRLHIERNIDIFMITHDPEEAALMSDRIYVLSDKPGVIKKEFVINSKKENRTLKDDEIYSTIDEIIDIFMELVEDYQWNKEHSDF
ncbi:MAG: ABC transporter ATP-binding protein [Halanaerobiales bacterium]|nr:ABC transporter ATP-binding protein [Halanaerobiales bacterium]